MGQPVVHWEIGGRDGAKLPEFYRTPRIAMFVDPEGHPIGLVKPA